MTWDVYEIRRRTFIVIEHVGWHCRSYGPLRGFRALEDFLAVRRALALEK
jgi:hypothetical protein